MFGKWGTSGLVGRHKFSDVTGKIKLKREFFLPPKGWEWEGDWIVDPERRWVFDFLRHLHCLVFCVCVQVFACLSTHVNIRRHLLRVSFYLPLCWVRVFWYYLLLFCVQASWGTASGRFSCLSSNSPLECWDDWRSPPHATFSVGSWDSAQAIRLESWLELLPMEPSLQPLRRLSSFLLTLILPTG